MSACKRLSGRHRVHVWEPTDPRELGPERPLLGMSEQELQAWRRQRAVHLYRTEPELRLVDIGERLGVNAKQVGAFLREAGISIREEGRDNLPAGPPVR